MWTQSGAHSLSNWVNSTISQASTWDTLAEPLRLDGSAVQSTDRIVLWSADRADGPYYLDGLAVTIASNYTVTYPEASISHTMDVGMVSWSNLECIAWMLMWRIIAVAGYWI